MSIFGRQKPHLHAVIDVGSHSIKAIIFEAPPVDKSLPRVLKKIVCRLPLGQYTLDAAMRREELKAASLRIVTRMRELIFATVREFERIPERIVVGLGANLAKYELLSLHIAPPKRKSTISRVDLLQLFEEALKINGKESETYISHPISVTINGYPLPQQKTEGGERIPIFGDIYFKVLSLSLEKEPAEMISQLRQSLGGMPIEFIPLVASYNISLVRFAPEETVFTVDVGGEYTTLSFFRKGELVGIESFPLGARHFIRGIAKTVLVSYEEAEDEKRRYIQDLMSAEKKKKFQEFLNLESKIWEEKFLNSLESFYESGPLPPYIFLFGGGAHLPEILNILKKPDWLSAFSYALKPQVRIIEAPSLFDGNSFGGAFRGPEEVGLASLMRYTINQG